MSAIGQNDRRIQYTTAGGESSFAYDFQIDDADHIQAYRDGAVQIRGTHYSVTGVGNAGGGTIVPDASLTIAAGEVWTITGDTPEDRSNDYSGFARVPPQTIDDDLDRMIFMLQQLRRDSNRAIRIDIEEATDEEALRLPGSAARASKTLGFDANGDVVVVDSFTSGASTPGDIDASVQDNDVIRWDSSEGDFKRVAMAVQSVLGRLASGTDTTAIALSEKQILGRLSGGDVKGLSQEEVRVLLGDPEHATDSATDAFVSATNTTPPADGVKITRDFQSANTTTTPTLDGKTMTTRDGSALWAGAVSGPHDLKRDQTADMYLVLGPHIAVSYVSVEQFGATGDGTTDDTTSFSDALTAASNRTGRCYVPDGTYRLGSITVPAGVALFGGPKSILKGLSSATGAWITLSAGSEVRTLEFDGTDRASGDCIDINAVSGCTAVENHIHDIQDGRAVAVRGGSSKYLVSNNRIEDIVVGGGTATHQAIECDSSNDGRVANNYIANAQHGIQWWGGDSATANAVGIERLVISGNVIRNVTAGIWGSLGAHISITGNTVENGTDVGIDVEGGNSVSVCGNTIKDFTTAGLATFYGATDVTFSGNAVEQSSSHGPCVHFLTGETSERIVVSGNTLLHSDDEPVIDCDNEAVKHVTICGNQVRINSATHFVVLRNGSNGIISNNDVIYESTIDFDSCIASIGYARLTISHNRMFISNDTSSVATDGGIQLSWVSSSFPAKRCFIHANHIEGFAVSIVDDPSGDNADSMNWMLENRCEVIKFRSGASYNGKAENNVSINDPNTAISASAI